MKINDDLKKYIEENIFLEYSKNEPAHNIDHIKYVINRSFKFTDEELFERTYKHLNMKFGENGYAKFFFKDEEYEKFLKDIRELLSDKNLFINTQRTYIKELKNKGVI